MPRPWSRAQALLSLGIPNLVRVALYRWGVATGLHRVRWLRGAPAQGPFFEEMSVSAAPASYARAYPATKCRAFGWVEYASDGPPPDWHANIISGARMPAPGRAWWDIPDFDRAVGDIKAVWELSRLDWLVLGASAAIGGDPDAINRMNAWLADWSRMNPPFRGPNWKCGQEASIRVMHLSLASLLLQRMERPCDGMAAIVRLHLARIAPTIGYAKAQDNNHGTSEAAALFIGGSWLQRVGDPLGARWAAAGRRLLEERVRRLVAPDGTFSQYSVNYHRLLLDTLSLVEVWRRTLGLVSFSGTWRARSLAATSWLEAMVDPVTGDAPNIGANDGARLLPSIGTGYRDYRPSVQLAAALFADQVAYPGLESANASLRALGVAVPTGTFPRTPSRLFDDGGFALLRESSATAVLRYPRFRFRPGHADALHLDLWSSGENLLRDGGTYSYNADPGDLRYFSGTASHNTVQFDCRDQMPRIGRFLFGDWLRTASLEPPVRTEEGSSMGASYVDADGAGHARRVTLRNGQHVIVRDDLRAFTERAVLRWRLRPGRWSLDGATLTDGAHRITVTATVHIRRLELAEGWESRYYLCKTPVPVLEVEIGEPGIITTEYHWG